jgi:hypothetical protein
MDLNRVKCRISFEAQLKQVYLERNAKMSILGVGSILNKTFANQIHEGQRKCFVIEFWFLFSKDLSYTGLIMPSADESKCLKACYIPYKKSVLL